MRPLLVALAILSVLWVIIWTPPFDGAGEHDYFHRNTRAWEPRGLPEGRMLTQPGQAASHITGRVLLASGTPLAGSGPDDLVYLWPGRHVRWESRRLAPRPLAKASIADDGSIQFDPVVSRENYRLTVGTAVTDRRGLPAVLPREIYVGDPVDVTLTVPRDN